MYERVCLPGAGGVSNAVIQHAQFHFRLQVDVARAQASRGDALGM